MRVFCVSNHTHTFRYIHTYYKFHEKNLKKTFQLAKKTLTCEFFKNPPTCMAWNAFVVQGQIRVKNVSQLRGPNAMVELPGPITCIAIGLEWLLAECLEDTVRFPRLRRLTTVVSSVALWWTVKFSGTPWNFYGKSKFKRTNKEKEGSLCTRHKSPGNVEDRDSRG